MALVDWSKVPREFPVTSIQFTKNAQLDVYPAVDASSPENSLSGKVVVVTGASRGIGAKAMVPAFIKAGVKGIALVATSKEKLEETERAIKTANSAIETLVCPLDSSNTQEVESAFEAIKKKFGHANVLVHCAAAATGDGPKLHETDPDQWWRNFEVNGKGTYLLVRAFLRQLPAPDAPATILMLCSWEPFFVVPPLSGYFISKYITDHLATYIAADYPNVTAVSLYPGFSDTDMLREPFKSWFDHTSPELLGGTAVWMCHEKAKFLSGRWVAVIWNMDELVARKEEIVKEDLLKMTLRGQFGA